VSILFAGLLVLLLAGPEALAAEAGAKEKKELRALRARIEALQKSLAGAEESKAEAADALRESERAISQANRELRELGARAREIDRRIAELGAEAGGLEQALKTQQALLARMLYQQHLAGPSEPLKLLLNREDPNEIARRLHYFGYLSRARAQLIVETREGIARLQRLAAEARQQAADLAAVTRESQELRARLEREKRAHAQVLARISRDIQRQRQEIGTLRRDEARLTRLVEDLARIVARAKPPPRPGGARTPPAPAAQGAFPELKGRLSLPVRGELANRFGSPRSDGGVVWKGLFIAARPGEEVRAVAGGRVVFADWLRGFGNLLIVDHGDAYMSLYGYNEALYKQVGDPIRAGEPIAAVGASGGSADSGLYFELRHQGKPLDPLEWMAVR
jgi:septal ring factor EnvC (AmiA/AmiB activator)